jgi:ATP-dependent Clp protease ATP-binding subunit ClpC
MLLAWHIANTEACLSGAQFIEPVHFLLAALMILDDSYAQAAEMQGLSPEALKSVAEVAAESRAALEMTDDEITAARRRLRYELSKGGEPTPLRKLSRSTESSYLFQKAARRMVRTGGDQLSLSHLLDTLAEDLPAEAAPYVRAAPPTSLPTSSGTRYDLGVFELSDETTAADEAERPAPKGRERASTTPVIDEMGRDLTALARAGRLTPVVGRGAEMTAIARYLQRTSKRNVIITGAAGVGKTAIVEGLAQRLVGEGMPDFLRRLRIVQLSVADLVSGAKYRGDMEQRVQAVIEEAIADPHLVLFFDEIHLMMKAGAGGGAPMDIANLLKPALARDDFRCIGATTDEEFERYIKDDAAFMRRFQVLRLGEPSESEALAICREWARRLEAIQQVSVEPEAVEAAVSLSARLIRGRSLPDKAIDLLENAAAYVKVATLSFDGPTPSGEPARVTRAEIERVLEEQYGIPARAPERLDPKKAADELRAQLVGQDEAAARLAESLAALGRRQEGSRRPLGVFLFTGPTGVGKTRAAELVARALFGEDADHMGRFNMSEYKERHELARLIGAPPGFVGHEQQGALFRFAESNPHGLILLDEMEKAHPEIQDYFLQIFDQGQARDSRGRPADFRQHLFVMTCNIVTDAKAAHRPLGFRASEAEPDGAGRDALAEQLARHFRPEFLARVDRVIAFSPLTADDYAALFERQEDALRRELEQRHGARLELTEEARGFLLDACTNQSEGARGFERLFERLLAAPLFQHLVQDPGAGLLRAGLDGKHLLFSRPEGVA